ncbi:hypothetical protein HanOQP8_Chr01g0009001 [Helianthus annuus]|nr:hypothetical protein HanOQP8_Chr01g0009001 [Helianthus annuus]
MKQSAVMKSSNIVVNVVADKFVDGHLHKFTQCSNENVHLYKQAYDEVVADNMFVDDQFQKLSKISDETGNFGRLPDLTMSSIGSAKFGALVGCPDKSMKHEINKVGSLIICLVVC